MGQNKKRKHIDVEVISSEPSKLPYVCYIPSSEPSKCFSPNCSFSVYQSAPKSAKNGPAFVIAKQDVVEYVAQTSGQEYSSQVPCGYALALYRPSEGKLSFMPIAAGRPCRMEPRLSGLTYITQGGVADGELDESQAVRDQRRTQGKRLAETFGSTRRQRQLEAREEGVVRPDKLSSPSAINRLMQQTVAAAAQLGVSREAAMEAATEDRPLPPHHLDATSADVAYVLEEIIPPGAMEALEVKKLQKAAHDPKARQDMQERDQIPAYVLSRVELFIDADPGVGRRRCRWAAWLAALLRVVVARPRLTPDQPGDTGGSGAGGERLALARALRLPPSLADELLEMFYEKSIEDGRTLWQRPSRLENLLLSNVLVAALLLENGRLGAQQFDALAAALKRAPSDMVNRFREVGAMCAPGKYKVESMSDSGSASKSAYTVSLLRNGKTLRESLPKIKMGGKKR